MERGAESREGTIVGGHLGGFWPGWDSLPRGHEGQKLLVLWFPLPPDDGVVDGLKGKGSVGLLDIGGQPTQGPS